MKKVILAARGDIPFDTLFCNARLVDVYTQRIIDNSRIGVKDGRIAAVNPKFSVKASKVVDCKGMYLAPSFIDAHMHIESSKLNPIAYCEGAIPHGTGCIFYNPMQILNISGLDGVSAFQKMLDSMPIEAYLQFPSFEGYDLDTLEDEIKISSYGEADGAAVCDDGLLSRLNNAIEKGYLINGHCPAMGQGDVSAASAAGLCDDHECTTYEELLLRLECGMSVMVRQGTIEPDCEPLIRGVVENDLPTDSLMFCTDDKSPEDIRVNGCIDENVRIAIESGLEPIKAYTVATLNAARHFGTEKTIGSVTPGRKANFILLDNLRKVTVKQVYYGGELVAENGFAVKPLRYDEESFPCFKSSVILPPLTEQLFLPKVSPDKSSCTATVMEMPQVGILTKRTEHTFEVKNGLPVININDDILPIAIIDRSGKTGDIGLGFIKGLGLKKGAIASSAVQEGSALAVSGTDTSDMLNAAREVAAMGGGMAISVCGEIVARQYYTVGGILSGLSIDDEISASKEFAKMVALTGSDNPHLFTALCVAPCSTIPDIGLTVRGLTDESGNIIPLIKD